MQPIKLLALCGSTRRNSLNARLLLALERLAPPALCIEIAPPLGELPYFSEDLEHEASSFPAVMHYQDLVSTCDGMLIATPEYNQSIPGVLKNAIDWLSRLTPEKLQNLPVGVMGCTTGQWGTRLAQAHLRHVLGAVGLQVVTSARLYVANADQVLANRETHIPDALEAQLNSFLDAVADAARAVITR